MSHAEVNEPQFFDSQSSRTNRIQKIIKQKEELQKRFEDAQKGSVSTEQYNKIHDMLGRYEELLTQLDLGAAPAFDEPLNQFPPKANVVSFRGGMVDGKYKNEDAIGQFVDYMENLDLHISRMVISKRAEESERQQNMSDYNTYLLGELGRICKNDVLLLQYKQLQFYMDSIFGNRPKSEYV